MEFIFQYIFSVLVCFHGCEIVLGGRLATNNNNNNDNDNNNKSNPFSVDCVNITSHYFSVFGYSSGSKKF